MRDGSDSHRLRRPPRLSKDRMTAKTWVSTPNADVISSMSYLDLKKTGPLVVYAPPNALSPMWECQIEARAVSICCCRRIGAPARAATSHSGRGPTTCSCSSAPFLRKMMTARIRRKLSPRPSRAHQVYTAVFARKGSTGDEVSERFEHSSQHDVSHRLQLLGEAQGARRLRAGDSMHPKCAASWLRSGRSIQSGCARPPA